MNPPLFFRCDGNQAIGYGHFFRCLSIAEKTRRQYENTFLLNSSNSFVKKQLQENNFPFIELPAIKLIEEAKWLSGEKLSASAQIVMDGYEFKSEYISAVSESGSKCIYIDDCHAWYIPADVIINHAPGISASHYKNLIRPDAELCAGLDYALIRNCFIENLSIERDGGMDNILICLGGVDFNKVIFDLLTALSELSGRLNITVVSPLPESLGNLSGARILSNQSGKEMADLMRTNDIMICPPSTLSIEAFFSRMCIMLVQTAENQNDIHQGMLRFANVKSLGSTTSLNDGLLGNIRKIMWDWNDNKTILGPFPMRFDGHKLLNIFAR